MTLNSGLQRPLIRTHDLAHFLPVLKQQKRRHRPDAQLLGYVADLVDVDLEELGLREFFAELGHLGRDDLARAAPCGEAVEDDEGGGVGGDDFGLVG